MKNKLINVIVLIICAAAVVGMVFFVSKDRKEYAKTAEAAKEKADDMNGPQNGVSVITYNGKKYKENTDIKSYLFMGVDEREDDFADEDLTPGKAGQADCLMLLVLNEKENEAKILQINRNAMTELDIYDELGAVNQTINGPICLQYAYCTGGKRSCIAQRGTVEDLLFGISIDGYLTMSLPGIADINDALGGVDVAMDEDYTCIDPSFTLGSTVHLAGDLATKYVQYRDTSRFNSVQDRMDRQTTYVTNMINSLKNSDGESLAGRLNDFIGNTILTDLNSNELNDLTTYDYELENVLYLPGEMTAGDEYEEYNVNNTELQDMVIDLFYTEAEE